MYGYEDSCGPDDGSASRSFSSSALLYIYQRQVCTTVSNTLAHLAVERMNVVHKVYLVGHHINFASSKAQNQKKTILNSLSELLLISWGVKYRFICGARLKSGLRSRILALLTVWGGEGSVRIGARSSRKLLGLKLM